MVHIVDSEKTIDQVAADLERAVARHQFGILGMHNLNETMAKKGVTFDWPCRIYEVCNPHQARKVLEAKMAISTALPCRISLYVESGKTRLATIRPTALLALYETPQLMEVAREVEATMFRIMEEAAR